MVILVFVIIGLCVLRKCSIYNKKIVKDITVKHVVNVITYTMLFCVCPVFAFILFVIFDLKPFCSIIKNYKGGEKSDT